MPRAKRHAQVIRPNNYGQHAAPKAQMDKPNGKNPCGDPQRAGKSMLFHLNFHRAPFLLIILLMLHLYAILEKWTDFSAADLPKP